MGGVKRQWGRMRGGIGENERDFHRVHFRDALAGPPTSWVPPGVLPFISLHPALAGIIVLAFHPAVEFVLLVMDPMIAMVGHIHQLSVVLVDGGVALSMGGRLQSWHFPLHRHWESRCFYAGIG